MFKATILVNAIFLFVTLLVEGFVVELCLCEKPIMIGRLWSEALGVIVVVANNKHAFLLWFHHSNY